MLTGAVRPDDVDAIALVANDGTGRLVRLPCGAALPVMLGALEYEVFHQCHRSGTGAGSKHLETSKT
uniref:Uncharacterized protein n=1 Tax=Oryza nivara TaxID=4536 RepID=A0A0E0GFK9_ORYNI